MLKGRLHRQHSKSKIPIPEDFFNLQGTLGALQVTISWTYKTSLDSKQFNTLPLKLKLTKLAACYKLDPTEVKEPKKKKVTNSNKISLLQNSPTLDNILDRQSASTIIQFASHDYPPWHVDLFNQKGSLRSVKMTWEKGYGFEKWLEHTKSHWA